MQDLLNSESNDEIDLRELFITLWAYKLFIAGTCALGILYGGYYALNADKEFTSTAIFKLHQQRAGGLSLGGEIGALANLVGLDGAMSDTTLPTDQVNGRIFIQNLDAKLNFKTDSYFNTYKPNLVDPIWKSLIKHAIGWQKSSSNPQEIIWQGIIRQYTQNVKLSTTTDGSIKVVVTHESPQRAAEIANAIMDEIITIRKTKKKSRSIVWSSKRPKDR